MEIRGFVQACIKKVYVLLHYINVKYYHRASPTWEHRGGGVGGHCRPTSSAAHLAILGQSMFTYKVGWKSSIEFSLGQDPSLSWSTSEANLKGKIGRGSGEERAFFVWTKSHVWAQDTLLTEPLSCSFYVRTWHSNQSNWHSPQLGLLPVPGKWLWLMWSWSSQLLRVSEPLCGTHCWRWTVNS